VDQHTRERLQEFADAANKDTLHPLDWRRFFDFIIHVHRAVPRAEEGELRDSLTASHLPARNVDRLVSLYTHGLDLLRRYDELGQ
jgi:hypothetical protein